MGEKRANSIPGNSLDSTTEYSRDKESSEDTHSVPTVCFVGNTMQNMTLKNRSVSSDSPVSSRTKMPPAQGVDLNDGGRHISLPDMTPSAPKTSTKIVTVEKSKPRTSAKKQEAKVEVKPPNIQERLEKQRKL